MLIETRDLLDCRQSGRVSPLTVVGRAWTVSNCVGGCENTLPYGR